MHKKFALFALLFASCSGGGGSHTFTASLDLNATHRNVMGVWQGFARSSSGGVPVTCGLRLDPPALVAPSFGNVPNLFLSGLFSSPFGTWQGEGSRVLASSRDNNDNETTIDVTIKTATKFSGVYRLKNKDGALVDSGTVDLDAITLTFPSATVLSTTDDVVMGEWRVIIARRVTR